MKKLFLGSKSSLFSTIFKKDGRIPRRNTLLCFLLLVPTLVYGTNVQEKKEQARLYLEQNELKKSYSLWLEILSERKCDPDALKGLEIIGKKWLYESSFKKEEVEIYKRLSQCNPNNAESLYFYGRALYQLGEYSQSQEVLEKCLTISPGYKEADILLGYIALQKKNTDLAKKIFSKYPDHPDAKKGLQSLHQNKRSSHLQQAKEFHQNLEYQQAFENYAWTILDDTESFHEWPLALDARSHTRPSLFVYANYTAAKEDDPDLRAPVVRDYYFLNKLGLCLPLADALRFNIEKLYYYQKEDDIYPPDGLNYSAHSNGGEAYLECFFAKYWLLKVNARVFHMQGAQNANFPFQSTTRFEPGGTLAYDDATAFASFNAHRESYIIKDFSREISKLLATDWLTFAAGYKIPKINHFEVQALLNYIFIRDSLHNRKNSEEVIAKMGIPFPRLCDFFFAFYQFEHGHYQKLNLNYYSYLQQLKNTLGITFHCNLTNLIEWSVSYKHQWQTTYNLLQPIGAFIFTQQKQYLITNSITSKIKAQYRDRLSFELEGHYFYESLPYRDWNLNGSLVWQF